MRKLNIAIIGLGNIGSYLFKFLNDNRKILTEKNNCMPIINMSLLKTKKEKEVLKLKDQWLNSILMLQN